MCRPDFSSKSCIRRKLRLTASNSAKTCGENRDPPRSEYVPAALIAKRIPKRSRSELSLCWSNSLPTTSYLTPLPNPPAFATDTLRPLPLQREIHAHNYIILYECDHACGCATNRTDPDPARAAHPAILNVVRMRAQEIGTDFAPTRYCDEVNGVRIIRVPLFSLTIYRVRGRRQSARNGSDR